MSEAAAKDAKTDETKEPPQPMQWFRATFVGEYFGTPNATAPKAKGRRLAPHVYRVEARDVVLLEAAPGTEAAGAEAPAAEYWQARIDEAHLPHVLGPGTAYRGPVFDVQLRQIQLSCPIEHGGRAYGRIEGSLRGAFVMPEKPAIPAVKVTRKRAPKESAPTKPLEATLSLGEEQVPRQSAPVEEIPRAPSSGLRGLAALLVLIGVALAVQSGPGYAAFFTLCALPILPLRWLFHELFRPTTRVRVAGFVGCLGAAACAALVVHAFRSCALLPWWPGLVTLLVLVPLAPLPSPVPAATGLLSLALIVGLFSAQHHRAPCHVTPKVSTTSLGSLPPAIWPAPGALPTLCAWKTLRAARSSGCWRSPPRSPGFSTSRSTTWRGSIAGDRRSPAKSC